MGLASQPIQNPTFSFFDPLTPTQDCSDRLVQGYFLVLLGTFGFHWVPLGTIEYHWVPLGTIGYYLVLKGTLGYFN